MSRIRVERHTALAPLQDASIAVIGYGNQGRAHALNLRDSGLTVRVGQRSGIGHRQAVADGFRPVSIGEAVVGAQLIICALPDESAPAVYDADIVQCLTAGQVLGFIHGFNLHYGRIVPPPGVDAVLVAPKAAGYRVRWAYEHGGGVPCLVAVHGHDSGGALAIATSWGTALHADVPCLIASTVQGETEMDLFGEQSAVVGGVMAVMRTAFETLVAAGHDPTQAYFECIHEVKFVVDLVHEHGLAGMQRHISGTAAYGGHSRAPRIAAALRPVFADLLEEIHDGRFASEWTPARAAEYHHAAGSEAGDALEQAGRQVRAWIAEGQAASPEYPPHPPE